MKRLLPLLTLFATASLLLSAVSAAEKLDLDRLTPVPASEPIPVMDFFRPRILQEPKLNPSGTHIAAIITAGEDRHQLLVYELKRRRSRESPVRGTKTSIRSTGSMTIDWSTVCPRGNSMASV
jgi:hypothetical protein